MRLSFFLVPLIITRFIFGWEINQARLDQKIKNPPEWATKQIEKELQRYPKVTKHAINATYSFLMRNKQFYETLPLERDHDATLIRLTIKNNKIIAYWKPTKDHFFNKHNTKLVDFFKQCTKYITFPNVDLLITTGDYFDFPSAKILAPIFAESKRHGSTEAILYPHITRLDWQLGILNEVEQNVKRYPWERKKGVAVWRGGTPGNGWAEGKNIRQVIVKQSEKHLDLLDAAFTKVNPSKRKIKDWLKKNYRFAPFVPPNEYLEEQLKNKYQLCIDGSAWASSLFWQLASNSAVIKNESPFIEWYYVGLKPFEHYIPYNSDGSNLIEQIRWAKNDDTKAKQIADQGRDFFLNHAMIEDMIAYIYHLLHAYAKIQKY